MDDKWFFYLTLFLALFVTSISAGFIPNSPRLNRPGMVSFQSAKAPNGLNKVMLMNDSH
jgi:hypothetical protein